MKEREEENKRKELQKLADEAERKRLEEDKERRRKQTKEQIDEKELEELKIKMMEKLNDKGKKSKKKYLDGGAVSETWSSFVIFFTFMRKVNS